MVIKWLNRYSRESGFVKNIDYKNRHFNHTPNYSEAKKFKTEDSANKAIVKLNEYGEGVNNYFEIIE